MSKAGLEALAQTYAKEMQSTRVRVNILRPGAIRTAMRAKAFPGEKPDGLPVPATFGELFVELASPDYAETGEIVTPGA